MPPKPAAKPAVKPAAKPAGDTKLPPIKKEASKAPAAKPTEKAMEQPKEDVPPTEVGSSKSQEEERESVAVKDEPANDASANGSAKAPPAKPAGKKADVRPSPKPPGKPAPAKAEPAKSTPTKPLPPSAEAKKAPSAPPSARGAKEPAKAVPSKDAEGTKTPESKPVAAKPSPPAGSGPKQSGRKLPVAAAGEKNGAAGEGKKTDEESPGAKPAPKPAAKKSDAPAAAHTSKAPAPSPKKSDAPAPVVGKKASAPPGKAEAKKAPAPAAKKAPTAAPSKGPKKSVVTVEGEDTPGSGPMRRRSSSKSVGSASGRSQSSDNSDPNEVSTRSTDSSGSGVAASLKDKPKSELECTYCGQGFSESEDVTWIEVAIEKKKGSKKVEKPFHTACGGAYQRGNVPQCRHCWKPIEDRGIVMTDGEGNQASLHEKCVEEYKVTHAKKCTRCEKIITEDLVKYEGKFYHQSCAEDQRKEAAGLKPDTTCDHCDKPLSGKYVKTKDGIFLHDECVEPWKEAKAPKCEHCKKPLVGGYVQITTVTGDKVKLHEACAPDFQKANAPKCAHCNKPLTEGLVKMEEKFYHKECADEAEKKIAEARKSQSPQAQPTDTKEASDAAATPQKPVVEKQEVPCAFCEKPLEDAFIQVTITGMDPAKVHGGDCEKKYREKHAPICTKCKEKILEEHAAKIASSPYHRKCAEAQIAEDAAAERAAAEAALKCGQCGKPIPEGDYIEARGGVALHDGECVEQWKQNNSPQCAHCGEYMLTGWVELTAKDFSGAVEEDNGKTFEVHDFCVDAFKKKKKDQGEESASA